MPERIVVADAYSWTVPNPNKAGEVLYYTARHGERVDVSDDLAARGEALGVLADEDKIAENLHSVATLEAEVARLTAELAAARSNQAPAMLAPPPAPPAGVTLTPSVTGLPAPDLPEGSGPIGPTTAAAVAAARAATGGRPVVSVTPAGVAIEAVGPLAHPDVNPTTTGDADLAPPPVSGASATDDELRAMTADRLVVYLNQHTDELDRIDELEAQRPAGPKGPRKTVTEAVDAVRSKLADVDA